MAKKDPAKPKKDRGAARRAKAAARGTARPTGPRTPSQDAANAWRQGISEVTAETVDQMAAHVQTVALQQLEQFGAFPAFLITARRDGEFDLDSVDRPEEADIVEELEPEDAQEITELHHSEDPESALRALALEKAPDLLGAALALPATLPDRSGAPALVIEVEHRDGVSLTLVQGYKVAGRAGAKSTELEDPTVEQRDPSLLRHPRPTETATAATTQQTTPPAPAEAPGTPSAAGPGAIADQEVAPSTGQDAAPSTDQDADADAQATTDSEPQS